MVFGLMIRLLESVKIFVTCLNVFARPNIIELKNLHGAGIQIEHQGANIGLCYYSITSISYYCLKLSCITPEQFCRT